MQVGKPSSGELSCAFLFLIKQKEDTDYFAGHVICLLL